MALRPSPSVPSVSSFARCVYVADDGCGHHKIGVTADPKLRLYHLRRDTKRPVEMVRVVDPTSDAEWIEMAAHWRLAEFHVHGEWFSVDRTTALAALDGAISAVANGERPSQRFIRGGRGVTFSHGVLARVEALVGPSHRTRFIREAVELEIKRRERIKPPDPRA